MQWALSGARHHGISPSNAESVSSAPYPTFSVLLALSEEENMKYWRNDSEGENDNEEGGSCEYEHSHGHSENDTDEESDRQLALLKSQWRQAFCLVESTKHTSCWGVAGIEPMPS